MGFSLSALWQLSKPLTISENNTKLEQFSNKGIGSGLSQNPKEHREVKDLSQTVKISPYHSFIQSSASKNETKSSDTGKSTSVKITASKVIGFVGMSVGACILGLMGFHLFFSSDESLFGIMMPPPNSLHRRYFNTFTDGCDSFGFKLQKKFYDYMMPLLPHHSAVEFTCDRNMEGLKCVLDSIEDKYEVSRIATKLFQKVITSLNKTDSFEFIKYFEELRGDITSNFFIPDNNGNYNYISPLQKAYDHQKVEVFNYLLEKIIVQKTVDSHADIYCTRIFLNALEQLQTHNANLTIEAQTKYYNFAKGAFLCLGKADAGYLRFSNTGISKAKIQYFLDMMIEKRLNNLESTDVTQFDKNLACDKALFKYAYQDEYQDKVLKVPYYREWNKMWDELGNCY